MYLLLKKLHIGSFFVLLLDPRILTSRKYNFQKENKNKNKNNEEDKNKPRPVRHYSGCHVTV